MLNAPAQNTHTAGDLLPPALDWQVAKRRQTSNPCQADSQLDSNMYPRAF